MTRVLLVDDHELVRHGIAGIIDREDDLEVVGEAGTVRQAVSRAVATRPDVVVLDVRLPDGTGIDACREIRSELPGTPCIMLTAFDDEAAREAAVLAGAHGWLLKDIRGAGLVDAVRRVAAGQRLMSEAEAAAARRRLLDKPAVAGDDLTLRERQILGLIAEGLTNKQIGERLGLAEKTVKNYVSGLLSKLGLERRTQAAIYSMTRPRTR